MAWLACVLFLICLAWLGSVPLSPPFIFTTPYTERFSGEPAAVRCVACTKHFVQCVFPVRGRTQRSARRTLGLPFRLALNVSFG